MNSLFNVRSKTGAYIFIFIFISFAPTAIEIVGVRLKACQACLDPYSFVELVCLRSILSDLQFFFKAACVCVSTPTPNGITPTSRLHRFIKGSRHALCVSCYSSYVSSTTIRCRSIDLMSGVLVENYFDALASDDYRI